jgi:hypothetical protein
MAKYTDLTIRFERVRRFLHYLQEEESKELEIARHREGPYRDAFVIDIAAQVEKEIEVIKRKTGAEDLSDAPIG